VLSLHRLDFGADHWPRPAGEFVVMLGQRASGEITVWSLDERLVVGPHSKDFFVGPIVFLPWWPFEVLRLGNAFVGAVGI